MKDAAEFVVVIVAAIAAILAAAALVIGLPLYIFGDRNVADLKVHAPAYLRSIGYEPIGREGFTYGLLSQPGGCVWYSMKARGDDRTIFTGCVAKWHDGTYELWGPKAVNAVSAH